MTQVAFCKWNQNKKQFRNPRNRGNKDSIEENMKNKTQSLHTFNLHIFIAPADPFTQSFTLYFYVSWNYFGEDIKRAGTDLTHLPTFVSRMWPEPQNDSRISLLLANLATAKASHSQ